MLYPLHHAQTDFSINDTSWMMNNVRSDTVVTCIGSRVQENVPQFGQNHKQSSYFESIDGPLILYRHKTSYTILLRVHFNEIH